ncbi:hypothetical protein C0Q70_00517 [Pomacea canaliculata]|uniref:Uncharacterized protein n=2 Tax=Pomacea canaliculata TaxID=400727 RepID=A0A2T7PWW4_POMCA|nr:hypothetical protein C0Q70_00517 [Pomacea canaliculata]
MPCREDLVVCHDDCCDRETQFCNDREMRCQSCSDKQVLCGNSTMPPACDLFCYKLQQDSTAPPQCTDRDGTAQEFSPLMIAGMVSLGILVLMVLFLLYNFIFRRKLLTKIIKMWLSGKDDNKKCTPDDQEQTIPLTESVNDKQLGQGEAQTSQPIPRVSEQETSGPSGSSNGNADTSALGVRSTPDTPTQVKTCEFDNPVNHVSKVHPAQPYTASKVFPTSSETSPTACMNGFSNIIPAEDKASSPQLPTVGIKNPARSYMKDF